MTSNLNKHKPIANVYTNVAYVNIGIKYDFPFINIRKVQREVLKTEGEANVNEWQIMFDRYYCINSK